MATVRTIHVRWATAEDLKQVAAMDEVLFKHSWSAKDYETVLRNRATILMVAESGNKIVGYMIYQMHTSHIEIVRFATMPRRSGFGRLLFSRAIYKVFSHCRSHLVIRVPESNLDAQLFFAAMGCKATAVQRWAYGDEDAYQFEYWPTDADSMQFCGKPISNKRKQ